MENKSAVFLDKSFNIPSLPTVYFQLTEAINSPRTSIADISDIISSDSGMTARLLRLANSAFYGFPSEIDTINRALILIGTREVRDLADELLESRMVHCAADCGSGQAV